MKMKSLHRFVPESCMCVWLGNRKGLTPICVCSGESFVSDLTSPLGVSRPAEVGQNRSIEGVYESVAFSYDTAGTVALR